METRRRVWWMAYMLDRCISVATGNPSYLDHKHSRILFPDDDVDLEQGTAGTDEHTSTEYQDTAKKAGPFNWRARVLQLIELQSEAIQVSNQLRDSPPDMDKEVLRQRLHQIALTFNRLGGREKSLETMDRVRRITARLAYLPDSDNGVRALKAYKVLFRTFAHCLHRTLQIIIGRAQMSLLDLDSSGNSANLPKQGNNLTALFANRVDIEIRESIVQAAVEIAELTRLIPNDLLFCTNAFHSFNVGMAGFVFNDVANAPDNDRRHQWPGISRGDAVYHMESLVSCLDIMSNWYKTLTSRRDMLKVLLFKAQARLSPSLFGDLASQEILKTMPPIMDNTMRSSRVVVSMATPKLTTLSLASTSSVQAYPSIGMPIDENSIIYRPAHWDSNQLATTTINTVKSEQEITPPPEVNSNYQYSYNITSR
ncbi:hypothetical protein BDF19DRAFT_65978 [Syncephalis fuscata]|nr:hypothetical protein BDF19DRAFT_65978 [Syncephalis fuscata]